MQTASVSELKANLSAYLRQVRRGGEIQVLDRGTPIARIVPAPAGLDSDRQRLIALGILRPGSRDPATILEMAPLKLPVNILEALLEDRGDRF